MTSNSIFLALNVVDAFEYSSDGFIKRYPDEKDYDAARRLLKEYFVANRLELKAREIIEANRDTESDGPGFSIRQTIRNLFVAMWSHAFTADRAHVIAEAMGSLQFDEDAFKKELTAFVRSGMLRSRLDGKRRLYEVNY